MIFSKHDVSMKRFKQIIFSRTICHPFFVSGYLMDGASISDADSDLSGFQGSEDMNGIGRLSDSPMRRDDDSMSGSERRVTWVINTEVFSNGL